MSMNVNKNIVSPEMLKQTMSHSLDALQRDQKQAMLTMLLYKNQALTIKEGDEKQSLFEAIANYRELLDWHRKRLRRLLQGF